VALLRGINVGGKNRLPMRELSRMFGDAGCREVRTYIQSGNVVFEAPAKVVKRLSGVIADRIEAELGLRVPVVLRSAEELAAVLEANPFLDRAAEEKQLHVMFLADHPAPGRVAALDPARSPPDEYAVVGRDVFLLCPNGMARSKLTNAWLDRALGTVSTSRNWRTVKKLHAMASGYSH
jgi:uncharacterized protein (DUF1697 family)